VLLRQADALHWPDVLNRADFEAERQKLVKQLPEAVKQARDQGRVDPNALKELAVDVKKMQDKLGKQVADIPARPYIESNRFLLQLEDAVIVLQEPDAAGKEGPHEDVRRVKTVADLVERLAEKKLKFAPPGPGQEETYRQLLQHLSAYHKGLNKARK
jgi:hypothetical protein